MTGHCIAAAASGDAGVQLPAHQSEIIFVGTGTSEGIPRVSCLTNPSKKCPVLLWEFLCLNNFAMLFP